jgi:glycosyltransferase involved in cell wall biosynthesis
MVEAQCSVIVPLYNKRLHVGRALESVLSQTHGAFELIVIDDGSTDGSRAVVNAFTDSRIRLLCQENRGVSEARNRGIREASTPLLAFLDADDEWCPDYLATIFRLRQAYPEAGLYAAAYHLVDHDGKERLPRISAVPEAPWEGILPSYCRSTALGDSPVHISAACVPKQVFDDVGLFTPGMRIAEDTEMWVRIARKYAMAFTWQLGARYHLAALNRACSQFRADDRFPFVERNTDDYSQTPDYHLLVGRMYLENARWVALAGDYVQARTLLEQTPGGVPLKARFLWGSPFTRFICQLWKVRQLVRG